MKTLKLFNGVLANNTNQKSTISQDGFMIEAQAMWAEKKILKYYHDELLSGNDINKTFHKSWAKIKNSSRFELLIEQITHYLSTYGSEFQDEVYIPDELLEIPDVKLTFKVVHAYTELELIDKCLSLLKSGIALEEETINDLLTILVDELNYSFTGSEGIRNKEAIIKIADLYGVLPTDTIEFFRYILYRTIGDSLLIKNDVVISAIKNSNYNPTIQFKQFGLIKLAEIFNRFKPLFLAYKSKSAKTINKISKLSKKYHVPLVTNPLNTVTSLIIDPKDFHWMDNATPYALFKALSACHTRLMGQSAFLYRIRNGKSWTAEIDGKSINTAVCTWNYDIILKYLKENYDLTDKTVFLPKDIKFGLPTSEKMFIGNIPTGTRFYGKKLAVGVYWRNDWGANDLDLSGINIGGKIGWNSSYNQNKGNLMYSGDITYAPEGAVEYLYANTGLSEPTLVMNNVYSGSNTCDYKIIIGKGNKVSKDFMMNPNKLFVDIKCQSIQKQTVLGIVIPTENGQCFVLLNFGAGNARVSGYSKTVDIATKALYQQWSEALSFNTIVEKLGAEIVDTEDDAEFNFALDNLTKDSFIKIFK